MFKSIMWYSNEANLVYFTRGDKKQAGLDIDRRSALGDLAVEKRCWTALPPRG